jgi:hypothetical protein
MDSLARVIVDGREIACVQANGFSITGVGVAVMGVAGMRVYEASLTTHGPTLLPEVVLYQDSFNRANATFASYSAMAADATTNVVRDPAINVGASGTGGIPSISSNRLSIPGDSSIGFEWSDTLGRSRYGSTLRGKLTMQFAWISGSTAFAAGPSPYGIDGFQVSSNAWRYWRESGGLIANLPFKTLVSGDVLRVTHDYAALPNGAWQGLVEIQAGGSMLTSGTYTSLAAPTTLARIQTQTSTALVIDDLKIFWDAYPSPETAIVPTSRAALLYTGYDQVGEGF